MVPSAGWIALRGRLRCCRSRRGCRHRPASARKRCSCLCGWWCRSDGSAADKARQSPYPVSTGRRAITSSNVPCRAGLSVAERGNNSYQAPKPACGRSNVEEKPRLAAACQKLRSAPPCITSRRLRLRKMEPLSRRDASLSQSSTDLIMVLSSPWVRSLAYSSSRRPSAISTAMSRPPCA